MPKYVLVKVIDEEWFDAVIWMGQNSGVDACAIGEDQIGRETLDRFEASPFDKEI